jgi:DNA (cytosine-5)-methyltransferase 1
MSLTITDLFCGAGGSGLGAHAAGYQLVMAANHWTKAIETHAANFPDTDHDCADISQVDPRRYPATDVLWASPECTNHSQAKGHKPAQLDRVPDQWGDVLPADAAERSRATMWDVPRFAEHHGYRAIVVENVVEAAKWVMFPAWLHAMTCLGYEHELVFLNSMHAPAIAAPRAPQSRDRLYVVFWRKGQRRPDVDPRPAAWCGRCACEVTAVQSWKPRTAAWPTARWGRYRQQYRYICPRCEEIVEPYALPAASAIDWALPGQRIGDRKEPLSAKTIARIEAGLRKFREPMTFEAAGNTFVRFDADGTPRYVRGWPVSAPTATRTHSSCPTTASSGPPAQPASPCRRSAPSTPPASRSLRSCAADRGPRVKPDR